MYHMNLPLEILRDTIIVIRPFTDKTEFRIVAVVDASEIGLEAAKAYAKRIVEAVNNYTPKREPEQPQCSIPAGYRKLGNDELMREGDVYLAIDSQPQDFPDIWYGKPAKLIAERVTTHTVLRPIETKMIHGKLMRKLDGDEYPQLGDWWGNDENDPNGRYKSFIIDGKQVSHYEVFPVFWRRLKCELTRNLPGRGQ